MRPMASSSLMKAHYIGVVCMALLDSNVYLFTMAVFAPTIQR
jgi:hypothetical protein